MTTEKAENEAARILFLLRRALPYVENAIDDDMRDTLIAEIVWELTANDALRDSLKDTP